MQEIVGPGDGRYRHGYARRGEKNLTYKTWASMFNRCCNVNAKQWPNYGGRGIKVCPEWRDYEQFLIDMGEKPKGMTLERINVDGDYCAANCKWATHKEQQNNRRNNRKVVWQGELVGLAEASRLSGIEYSLLYWRAVRMGWEGEKLFRPLRRYGNRR